jgi:acetolactate synthase-1/2/3 large subunit
VREAAQLLGSAERPVIFAGAGTRWAECSDELDQLSRTLEAPVLLNSLGRGMLPSNHDYLMPNGRRHALGNADVILALGIEWDFRIGFGRKGIHPDAKVIQVDMDNREIGRNRPVDIGITGHIRTVLRQLLELDSEFGHRGARPWVKEVREYDLGEQQKMDQMADSDDSPVHPHRFAKEVRDWLSDTADDGIVVGDGGDIVATAAKWVRVNHPGHWLDPGPFGCLGVGMPFALAAKLAKPDKAVTIIYGDGSFGLNGMEYDTAIRHNLPIVGVVGNDGGWNQIKVPHAAMYGEDRVVAADLGFVRYDRMVEGLGGYGEFVEKPTEIRPALERAAESGLPALINVKIQSVFRESSVYGV